MEARSLVCLRVRAIDQKESAMCKLAERGRLYEELLAVVSGIGVPTCTELGFGATAGLKAGCLAELLD
jgi:hypothetical protein